MAETRVLVVEDETLIRMMMVDILTDAGFDVDEAESADEAEHLIDKDGYKLLVTDIHMPGRHDGIQLAERLHKAEPAVPILFVTARPDVLARIRGAGMNSSTVCKPFSAEHLVSAVRGILRRQADIAIT